MSQLADFARFAEQPLAGLHAWSITELEEFWARFLRWSGLIVEGDARPVLEGDAVETARFFPGLRLSYVENLLAHERSAIIAVTEDGGREELSRDALARRAAAAAAGLRALGVQAGDRVVALVRNGVEAVVAALAATGLGAIWSSASPDLAVDAVLDRFRPLAPRLLVHDETQTVHGVARDVAARAQAIAAGLGVVAVPLRELRGDAAPAAWPRFPFNHPLFVLFSSGTTGPPKCIVHGLGGTLLEHVKEHRLHGDLGPGDRLMFATTAGWMMWNWQLSALAAGATIVLHDGSATFPETDALFAIAAAERVTVLGVSPTYLSLCRDAGAAPRERHDLGALRAILSTGSVLADSLYGWTAEAVKDVPLQSISGGTDIIGCFALGHPEKPVVPGELQALGLGLDVRAEGAGADGVGELICARPFPSRPLGLWGDEGGRRFHDAYFAQHPGVWTHGDFIQLTPSGGARILGRSDGVLNVRGVRIGPAEILRALEAVAEVAEAMPLEQQAPGEPGGSRLVLLVVLRAGVTLDRPLTLRIKRELSQRCSQNHVPQVVAQVAALPVTHSGKRSDRAARDALHGRPVVNATALRNPEALREIADHPALKVD